LAASIPIQSGAYKTSQYAAALHEYLRAKVEQRAPEVRIEPKGKFIPQVINIMDALKSGIGLRGYGQKDPRVEYEKEAYEIFEDLKNNISDEAIKALIEDSLTAEKTVWAEIVCKKCRRPGKYPVVIPDIQARAKVLDIMATQGKGKPTETKKVDVEVRVRQVEAMTDAELEAEEARLVGELAATS